MLFQWSRLEAGTIRLVRFLPYSTPSNLYLALEHRTKYWDEAVHYTALSYVYGDRNDRKPITLAGRSFMITANLYAALVAVYARGDGNQWFWVDQLCLNHQNAAEKNSQVAHMGAIYASADRVVAWLRPEDDAMISAPTEAGMEIRNEYLASQHHETDMAPVTNRMLPAIPKHCHWQRAWTTVEARRARELEVIYGDHLIKAGILSSLHAGTHVQDDNLKSLLPQVSDADANSGSDNVVPSAVLKEVIHKYSECASSNGLDRVFAMLNDPRLGKLPSKHRPRIDYGFTAAELAADLVSWYDDLCQMFDASSMGKSHDDRRKFCSYVAVALHDS